MNLRKKITFSLSYRVFVKKVIIMNETGRGSLIEDTGKPQFNVTMSWVSFVEKETNSTWGLNKISRSRESLSASGTHFYRVMFP